MNTPQISIICNTYNQEKYIAQALDSFLMQKIDVPFEVLVHDDASTDSTPDIVREYEAKYPEIIKPIYQTENQYCKRQSITAKFQMSRAKGKYIAFCEGDDYWSDPDKLRLQYEYMEAHEDCSACCHAYSMVDKDGNLIEERYDFSEDCDIPLKRLIGNQLLLPQFATLMIRSSCVENYDGKFLGYSANDMILRIKCALLGDFHYINKNMSCYRRFTEHSWTVKEGKNKEKLCNNMKRTLGFFEKLNEHTEYKYNDVISYGIDEYNFKIALLENNFRVARKTKSYKNASFKQRCYITIGCVFPKLIAKLRK